MSNDRYLHVVYNDRHDRIELEVARSFHGPASAITIHLDGEDALDLLFDLAILADMQVVPGNSIVFDPCDGRCNWCGPTCSNKQHGKVVDIEHYRRNVYGDSRGWTPPYKAPGYDPGSTPTGMWTAPEEWYKETKRRWENGDRDFT